MLTFNSPSLLAAFATRRRAHSRRVLSRKLRLESLERRLTLNAAPLPFEGDLADVISPAADAGAVEAAFAQMGSNRESLAVADRLQEPLRANLSTGFRNRSAVEAAVASQVCWPATRASVIERLEGLMNELAQARHIPLEMLRAKLPMGPQLPDAPTVNDPKTVDADGQDHANVDGASDADTATSPETPPIHSGSSDSATSGEGESSSGDGSGDGSSSGSGTSSGDGSGTSSGDGSGASSGDGSGASSGDGSGTSSGSGSGTSSGTSSGDGSGTSSGDGSGASSGDGSGTSSGDGSGTSSGDGSGTSSGDGSGDQSDSSPLISAFSVVAGEADLWIASGQVVHAMPWTITIVFGGVFEGHSTSVQTSGYFYKVFPMGESGIVTAQAFDGAGVGSNVAFALVYSPIS